MDLEGLPKYLSITEDSFIRETAALTCKEVFGNV